jgi:acyl-CoA thioester hydrolase
MARIKIEVPEHFSFSTLLPVRITDLNYGGHVGNDKILTFAHEARMRFLAQKGFTEMDIAGAGLIMADAMIEFKKEIFYGDEILVSVTVSAFSRAGFDLVYLFEKISGNQRTLLAVVKTAMVCYDYKLKKIVTMPESAKLALVSA